MWYNGQSVRENFGWGGIPVRLKRPRGDLQLFAVSQPNVPCKAVVRLKWKKIHSQKKGVLQMSCTKELGLVMSSFIPITPALIPETFHFYFVQWLAPSFQVLYTHLMPLGSMIWSWFPYYENGLRSTCRSVSPDRIHSHRSDSHLFPSQHASSLLLAFFLTNSCLVSFGFA